MALRDLAKLLPHPLLMGLFHAHYHRNARKLTKSFSRETGVPLLETIDLGDFRRSDTVFILGSGPSINSISDARWNAIARHDTIGFNMWPVHRFVPRIFVFESTPPTAVFHKVFLEQLRRRADDYRNALKIITEIRPLEIRDQMGMAIRDRFPENYFALETIPFVARSEEEAAMGFEYMRTLGAFRRTNRVKWIFKYGGSVTGMISLAMQLGYRNIVLCGVDLGPQHYFYQDPALYPEHSHWEFAPKNDPHLTTRKLPYLVPAQQVLWTMKRVILDPAQVNLYVENSSSTLYPKIPVAPDAVFDR